jgi:hypothetical protein
MGKVILKIIAAILFFLFWVGAVIGLMSCNKANEIGQVEVIGFVVEKIPLVGKVKLDFGIYDDIGMSFVSEKKKSDQLPLAWAISYQVPNFKNDYAVLLNTLDDSGPIEMNVTAAYFKINFSSLSLRPPVYVYENNDVRIVLRLKWY